MAEGDRKDREARFAALVSARRPALVRSANRILGDAIEAEDVVQEALAGTWERLDAIQPGAFKAYLFRAVELNSLKRRARRRRHLPLDAAGDVAASSRDEAAGRLDPMEFERALAGLSPTQQAVLRMKYYAGMTFREIGRSLAVSKDTAAGRCRRALEVMRKTLTSGKPK